jgi:hypothetical protein
MPVENNNNVTNERCTDGATYKTREEGWVKYSFGMTIKLNRVAVCCR